MALRGKGNEKYWERIMWSKKMHKTDSDLWWLTYKISMVSIQCFLLIYILYTRTEQPFPSGICRYVDCSFFTREPFRIFTVLLLLVASAFYIREKGMLWSTLVLSVISIFLYSLEESNGNPAENGVLSLIFFTQFIAYLIKKINPAFNVSLYRLQFSAQAFAALYVLAAISKLNEAGLGWFLDDSPKFSLEILRIYYGKYVSTGDVAMLSRGNALADFIMTNLPLMKILLGTALLLEAGAFILAIYGRVSAYYAFLLLCMHVGIYIFMDISFPTVVLPLIVLFMNPLFWGLKMTRINKKMS